MDDVKADLFHSLTSKSLYIIKSKIPDIEPAVGFLNTRVVKSNVGDWKKLIRCISYLNQTVGNVSIVGGFNLTYLFIWVDASYDVHPNMRSQTVVLMLIGYENLHCQSSKQNMNENISTEAELIVTSEYVNFNVWVVILWKHKDIILRRILFLT